MELKGFDEFKDYLESLNKGYSVNVKRFVGKIASKTSKIARDSTPVKTGRTRRSWKIKNLSSGSITSITVYNTSPVSHLLEDGHVIKDKNGQVKGFKAGEHMLKSALKEVKEGLEDDFMKEFFK
ncbi:HK97 gp10 family phage protein [Candidatus Arthromitus sp. SFB-mouse-NL]|uniref:HK97 gp10 family phage protein n=1 Tax=Candidatus Arthromitus sp. SFB-mouse-NL TaxID=1508644 RepID=UPI0009DE22D2